ncbi:MAG: hypothetical protein CVU71_03810 [Deltaproteobacteria bacterium HGW-Deltaproteobacteria-6]|jgi:predicted secreted protein|nr:MAG: hypothetical protein CVU71_03810 [Deltaproteobacteria bacterium HGW-Deltaproteobacteria-6]
MKPLTAIWIFVVLACAVVFYLHWQERQEFKRELAKVAYKPISKKDVAFIASELRRKKCDDAIVTRTDYGYLAREIKSGKNFKVVME